MSFRFASIASIATRVLSAVVTSIPIVEAAKSAFGTGTGAQKKAAVMDIARAELAAAELIAGRDLADDPAVIAALSTLIDAGVAWHQVLAKKTAPVTP